MALPVPTKSGPQIKRPFRSSLDQVQKNCLCLLKLGAKSYYPLMRRLTWLALLLFQPAVADGPYPTFSGISAGADDAGVAGTNPAAMTLFDERQGRFEVLAFSSDTSWKGSLGEDGPETTMKSSSSTAVPVGSMVMPLRNDWWFGFTVLGNGFSEEFDDDWVGRYLLQEYELVYISAFPSIAKRVTDKLSIAGSLALTYTTYEQRKAVLNIDPGYGDGTLRIDTDGLSVGFGLSSLYEFNENTRMGFNYLSEIEPSLDGRAKFSDLGPITENILDKAGLLNAKVDVTSRQPQSVSLGVLHDRPNGHTVTVDAAWSDFSRFLVSEIYLEGEQIIENQQEYDDAIAFTASYSWPVSDRLRLGVGGLLVSDIVGRTNRTMAFRLDDMWSLGFGVKWKWRDNRTLNVSLNYLTIGDAPVESPSIPGVGPVTGRYTSRHTVYLRASLSFGPGPRA